MILAVWQIYVLIILIPLALLFAGRILLLLLMQWAGPKVVQPMIPVYKATAPMPLYMQVQLKKHQTTYYQQFAKKQDYS